MRLFGVGSRAEKKSSCKADTFLSFFFYYFKKNREFKTRNAHSISESNGKFKNSVFKCPSPFGAVVWIFGVHVI